MTIITLKIKGEKSRLNVNDQVIILLATVASVHRLILPHPKKLNVAVIVSFFIFI